MREIELRTVTQLAASTTAEYVMCPAISDQRTLHVTSVRAEDISNTVTYFDLVIKRAGLVFVLDRYYPATASKIYTFKGDWFVPENCQIGVMFYGATAADVVTICVNGVYES
jgi:hypothetical protein